LFKFESDMLDVELEGVFTALCPVPRYPILL